MKKYYIGIDPGKNGAVAVIDRDGQLLYMSPFPKNGSELDLSTIYRHMVQYLGSDTLVALELPTPLHKAGNSSSYNFGRAVGAMEGMLAAANVAHIKPNPKAWQKVVFKDVKKQASTKATAYEVVSTQWWPNVDFTATARSRKPHDGMVDACCLAIYALQSRPLGE